MVCTSGVHQLAWRIILIIASRIPLGHLEGSGTISSAYPLVAPHWWPTGSIYCFFRVWKVHRRYIVGISQVYRKYIAGISRVSRGYIAGISVYRRYIAGISVYRVGHSVWLWEARSVMFYEGMLETCWKHAGTMPEPCWKHAVCCLLEPCWKHEACW